MAAEGRCQAGGQSGGHKPQPSVLPPTDLLPPMSSVNPLSLGLLLQCVTVILGSNISQQPRCPWGSPHTPLASAARTWYPAGPGHEGWQGISSLGCSPEGSGGWRRRKMLFQGPRPQQQVVCLPWQQGGSKGSPAQTRLGSQHSPPASSACWHGAMLLSWQWERLD